jgi:hypothetical protein
MSSHSIYKYTDLYSFLANTVHLTYHTVLINKFTFVIQVHRFVLVSGQYCPPDISTTVLINEFTFVIQVHRFVLVSGQYCPPDISDTVLINEFTFVIQVHRFVLVSGHMRLCNIMFTLKNKEKANII